MPYTKTDVEIRSDLEADLGKWRNELDLIPDEVAYQTIRTVIGSRISSGDALLASVDEAG